LQASLNVPAVAVLEAVGPSVLAARMRRAGAPLRLPQGQAPGLPVALGGGGVTLADLVTLYAAMARGGEAVALRWRADAPQAAVAPRLLAPRAAWQLAEVLAGAVPPAGAAMAGGARAAVAWKTGTSYGYRDAWALGFDGRHTVGVWLGRADGGAVPGLTGIDAAAPLMFALFGLLPGAPLPPRPATLPVLAHADLPPGLRRFGAAAAPAGPEIAMPPDGARVERSAVPGAAPVIALRLREGVAPFTWMLDGRPLPLDPFARSATWPVPEPGFLTITVIDATGAAASSTVFAN
jgi:penicillin-binding protein 1C